MGYSWGGDMAGEVARIEDRIPHASAASVVGGGADPRTDSYVCHHNGAGGLSFVDGHAEIKRWLDLQDLRWLQERLPGP